MKTAAQGNVKLFKKDTITKRESVLSPGTHCYSPIQPPADMIRFTLPLALPGISSAETALPDKLSPQLITEERTIRGKIINDRGEPVGFATVFIKGTRLATVAKESGLFSITPEKGWKSIVLIASCVGYETTEIRVESSNPDVNVLMPVTLRIATTVGLIVTKKPAKSKTSIPLLTQKLMDTAFKFFKVFPNPVASGASLHIEWKQTEEGYFTFELFDLSGRKVYSKEVWIDEEARLLNLEVPSVKTGNYLLRATHNESGKGFTEKITVQ